MIDPYVKPVVSTTLMEVDIMNEQKGQQAAVAEGRRLMNGSLPAICPDGRGILATFHHRVALYRDVWRKLADRYTVRNNEKDLLRFFCKQDLYRCQ
ncbi:hypothetical protein GC093_04840 [Paenibacillus sp. LMG 31456]|uniref:Uncharacterized protein n=1 Tax=Paenibacillus foliorum TaxID=2654974 RepID=A0A972K066_9BACL|nr:hypothetical protein [Paenibacillus foliorum]NOU92558.1 hypothetical protein [Paenibacillus foliorum]